MHIEKRSLFESLESRQFLSASPAVELEAASEPFAAITANPTAAVSDVNGTYTGTASIDGGSKIPLTITITDKNNQKRVKVICGGLRPKFLVTFSQSGPHYMIANYPVGNGKSILIQIKDGQKITIDGSADIPILGPIQFSGSGTRSGSVQSAGSPIDTAAKANPLVGTYKGELEPVGLPRTFYDVTAIVEKKQGTDKHRLQLRIKVPDFGQAWINYQIGPNNQGTFHKQVPGGPELDGSLKNNGKFSLTIHFTDSRQSFVATLNPLSASFTSAFSPTAAAGINGTYSGTATINQNEQPVDVTIRDSSDGDNKRVKFKVKIKKGIIWDASFKMKFKTTAGGYKRGEFDDELGSGTIDIKNGKMTVNCQYNPLLEPMTPVSITATQNSGSLTAPKTLGDPTAAKNPLIGTYSGTLTRLSPFRNFDVKVSVVKSDEAGKLDVTMRVAYPGLGHLVLKFTVNPDADGKFRKVIGKAPAPDNRDHVFEGNVTKNGKFKYSFFVPPLSPLIGEADPVE